MFTEGLTEQNWLLTGLYRKRCCLQWEELTEEIRRATTDTEIRADPGLGFCQAHRREIRLCRQVEQDESSLNVVTDSRIRGWRGQCDLGTERWLSGGLWEPGWGLCGLEPGDDGVCSGQSLHQIQLANGTPAKTNNLQQGRGKGLCLCVHHLYHMF